MPAGRQRSAPLLRACCLAGALFLFLCGCGQHAADRTMMLEDEFEQTEPQPALSPFSVKVLDEVNDGAHLYLRVRIVFRRQWDSSQVSLILRGLRDGLAEEAERFPLRKLIPEAAESPMLPAGAYVVSVHVPAVGLTDYQLELAWEKKKPQAVELRGVRVEQAKNCGRERCAAGYQVAAELFNSGSQTVQRVVLGLSFTEKGGPGGHTLENQVEIEDLSLDPGSSREVRLEVESPEGADLSRYAPKLRMISFE